MPDGSTGQARLDFATGQASSVEQLAGATPSAVNVLVDDAGAVHLRPGIATWTDFAEPPLFADSPVLGMAVFQGSLIWVTTDRLIHRLVSPGYAVDLSDATATTQLDGTTRPTFAVTRNALVMAGSGSLQKWDGAAALSARLGGSPPSASHVVALNQGLVVNVLGNTGQIQWSDTDIESWPALNFKELETSPDPLPALYENTGELVGMGTDSIEMLSPTTSTVDNAGTLFFNYEKARVFEMGNGAPYAFAQWDERFAFLDDRRRIVQSDGRSFKVLSDPAITETLQSLGTVSDAWAFRLQAASWNLIVFVFPTDGRAFCFDTGKEKWTEWRGWDANGWAPFAGQCVTTWRDSNVHLVGLSDGTIGRFDFTSATDAGQPVVGEVVTGFLDNGTSNYKHCQALRLRFRRGIGAAGSLTPPKCQISWRDDLGPFEDPIDLDMGAADDVAPTIDLRSLGLYRERQWKLRMSDTVPLVLASAEITYEVSDL